MPEEMPIQSLYAQRESIWWIDSIPIQICQSKLYKLVALNSDLQIYFKTIAKAPIDTVLLCLFYLVMSYLPSILITALLALSRRNKDKLPRSGFVFNQ